jgi:hypothetical protein
MPSLGSRKRELREMIEVQRPDVLVSDVGLRDGG